MNDTKKTATQDSEAIAAKQKELDHKIATVDAYKKAMAVRTNFMNPDVWTQIRSMSKIFFESRALPKTIQNEPQLVMMLQAGYEMGMTPVESLHSLYMVNGTINVYGKAVTRRIREHGWRIEYKDESDESCTATVSRDDESYTETYTHKMAVDSGYTKSRSGDFKVGWLPGVNRRLKLRYGVLSLIIKSYIPEVLGSAQDISEVAEDVIIQGEEANNKDGEKQEKPDNRTPAETSTLAEKLEARRKKKSEEEKQAKKKPEKPEKKTKKADKKEKTT